jgi:hypothetical protein
MHGWLPNPQFSFERDIHRFTVDMKKNLAEMAWEAREGKLTAP